MKKITLLLVLAFTMVLSSNAQIIKSKELEKYAKEKYGKNWVDAAGNLKSELTLDKNNGITYTQVIEAPNKSKDQLYVMLNYWFTASFNDSKSVIKLNDKSLGTIIAQGRVNEIAVHGSFSNTYHVDINPIIRCDIKDGKIRVMYTVPYYNIVKEVGGGMLGALSANKDIKRVELKWTLDECYPFVNKDSHKRTSSKALIMSHAYSNVIMDKIEECIKNGLTGGESEDW